MPVEPSPERVNELLTEFSVLYLQQQEGFGYHQVFSMLPVEHRSDSYMEYGIGQFFTDEARQIAPGEEAPVGNFVGTEVSYLCRKYALRKGVTEEDYDNAGNRLGPQRVATAYTTQKVMIALERLFANNFLTTGIWGADMQGVASGPTTNQFVQWDAASNVTILKNVEIWKEKVATACGQPPNVLGLSPDVYAVLRSAAEIRDLTKYTSPDSISLKVLARLFDLERVVVMGGIYNSAKQGATPALTRVASKKILLAYSPKVATPESVTAGICFGWKGKRGLSKYGTRVTQWYEEATESDIIQTEAYVDLKKICAPCGLYAYNVIA
ncbi:MAG TPA: hypothetical protein PLQ01_02085 [Methanothrix sp.]|nr:hypothetical protein [Methanothrix sp.]